MTYNVAVLGATGNVGRKILSILAEREFPINKIAAIASSASIGREVSYGEDQVLKVEALDQFNFAGFDLVLSSIRSDITKVVAPRITEAGAVLIDNSSAFRMDLDVPLVVPEVNGSELSRARIRNIVASPNCITTPLVMALKPLHDIARIKRIVLSTYQSTSGAGWKAMDELNRQTRDVLMNVAVTKEEFPRAIAYNVIPQINNFEADGTTGEEVKVVEETRKIIDSAIAVFATCVRVPVFIGHSISANIEFETPISPRQAADILKKTSGVYISDRDDFEDYITPLEITGEDDVFISRIRKDPTVENGLAMWIVSDNLRKGAALNTVQIAESLVQDYWR